MTHSGKHDLTSQLRISYTKLAATREAKDSLMTLLSSQLFSTSLSELK